MLETCDFLIVANVHAMILTITLTLKLKHSICTNATSLTHLHL